MGKEDSSHFNITSRSQPVKDEVDAGPVDCRTCITKGNKVQMIYIIYILQ